MGLLMSDNPYVAKNFADIRDYPHYWTQDFVPAPYLPMSRKEMDKLGWDSCDIIMISGDAYVDHPSFCTAIIGRYLESFGFRVGVIAQPDWHSKEPFMVLGKPNLFFGVTAGNMDSMINHYTAERRIRSDDAYTPGDVAGKRPDRASVVYSQRLREAYGDTPIVLGGIEASLRRFAHYDYWSDTVKNSVLPDSRADIIVYGNGERPIIEIAWRLSKGESINDLKDIRGTAVMVKEAPQDFKGIDARVPAKNLEIPPKKNPYCDLCEKNISSVNNTEEKIKESNVDTTDRNVSNTYILIPSADDVKKNKPLYAQASHVMIQETNPFCARAIMQQHGNRYVWVNPPAFPLTPPELDYVYQLPYQRKPHPAYGKATIPAFEMIRNSVAIMRGCFGGCTFCSITAHEGRIIQSRSQESVIDEISEIKKHDDKFNGVISDLGGPSANMYCLGCKDPKSEHSCRRNSCLYPTPCGKLNTDHANLIKLYRAVRALPYVKRVMIASGVRLDLVLKDPKYIKELVLYHVGGLLKIAPEHTEPEVLKFMHKPGNEIYEDFKKCFDRISEEAGKKQYLIPYFMSSHPGSSLLSMVHLALWLKKRGFKLDQVQNFIPTPMAGSSTMYHTGIDPYEKVTEKGGVHVYVPLGDIARRRQKAILRYHDPANFPIIRDVLRELGLERLIGTGPDALVVPERMEQRNTKLNPRYGFAKKNLSDKGKGSHFASANRKDGHFKLKNSAFSKKRN